ncbi:MAG: hypothetical protein LBU28_09180 [Spirochaetaceae bacterium]|jgi:hypothetical protein|nr:hypothetical protein [Spirochaetaceae bacterium]
MSFLSLPAFALQKKIGLDNGFSLIERECDAFNQKIESVRGSIFPRHQYSEEELFHSGHLDKIRAIAGKMGNDIENWQTRGKVSPELKAYYDDKTTILNERFQIMMYRLKSRNSHVWDRISEFFLCSYYFIINIALHHLKNLVIPCIKDSNTLAKPFKVLQKTAEMFENFLNEMSEETHEIINDFNASPRSKKRA